MWKWKVWMSLLLGLQVLCGIGGLLLILLALYHADGWSRLPAMLCMVCVLPFSLHNKRHSQDGKTSGVTILTGLAITALPLLVVLFAPPLWRFVGLVGYTLWWCEKLVYRAGMRSVQALRKLRIEHST